MADAYTIMRSLHILVAVLWGGSSIVYGTVIRKLGKSEPSIPRVFAARSFIGPFLGVTSLLTLVFGLGAYFSSPEGAYDGTSHIILSIGMLAGTIGVLVGWAGHMPNMVKLGKLINDGGSEVEIERRLAKEETLDTISLVTVVLAVLAMSFFRLF